MDDATAAAAVAGLTSVAPLQKAVLTSLSSLPPAIAAAGAWPDVLAVLCGMLRPYDTLALRQAAANAPAGGAAPAAAAAAATAAGAPSAAEAGEGGSSGAQPGSQAAAGGSAAAAELAAVRYMSPAWMARVTELAAGWYRDHVPWQVRATCGWGRAWVCVIGTLPFTACSALRGLPGIEPSLRTAPQVRVATFPLLAGALSECMAVRHLQTPPYGSPTAAPPGWALALDCGEPLNELWRAAARGFVAVVSTGLPSINICGSGGAPSAAAGSSQPLVGSIGAAALAGGAPAAVVPDSTWPVLARAFQMFFLAVSLPPLRLPPPQPGQASAAEAAAAGGAAGAARGRAGSGPAEGLALASVTADVEAGVALLDCLADTVLASCQLAPSEVRPDTRGLFPINLCFKHRFVKQLLTFGHRRCVQTRGRRGRAG